MSKTVRTMAVLTLACATASSAGPASRDQRSPAASPASDAAVLATFLARPDEPVRAFRARRHLEVSAALGQKAWMDALVELDPGQGFRYQVLAAGGSGTLQQKVLHRVLRSEQEVYAEGGSPRTALTGDNYLLEPGGRDPSGLVRLRANARRREAGLLDGEFLVTPDSADLVEVSGTLAQGTGFMVPRVDIRKRYQRIRGHRVNVAVESTSHVRLFGESRFSMTTQYETIEGEAVAPAPALADTASGAARP